MHVISRRTMYPDAVNDKPIANKKENEFVFDFKLCPVNDRNIVPGKDYWAAGQMSCYVSNAYKQNLPCKTTLDGFSVFESHGVIVSYKIEGDFDEWQIKVIKGGLASGLAIKEVYDRIEQIGWEKAADTFNVIKS